MKSTSFNSRVLVTSIQPTASPASTPSAVTSMATGNPTSNASAARRARYVLRRTSATANAGQRAEFRPDHHRADHRHGRVGDDADRGDQARQTQERQESDVERGLLARPPGQFVPDHRVGGVACGLLLGAVGARRQDGVDDVQRDRPALLHAERLQRVDDLVGGLAGDVGGDLVAHRVLGGVAVYHQMGDAGIVGQGVDHRIGIPGAMIGRCSISTRKMQHCRAANLARLSRADARCSTVTCVAEFVLEGDSHA